MDKLNQFNQLKVLCYKKEIEQILDNKIPYPVTVEIDPSNLCNHKCSWCFYKKYRDEKRLLFPKMNMFKLIEELIDIDVKSITFTGGGEPLLNPATIEAIEKFGNKIDIGLVTNGGLLKGKEKLIVENCKYIRISLDAGDENTYEKVHRVKFGEFDRVINSIKRFVKVKKELRSDIFIGATFLICKENYRDILKFVSLMKEIKVDYVYLRPVLSNGGGEGERMNSKIIEELRRKLLFAKLQSNDFKVFINYKRIEKVIDSEKDYLKCFSTPLISVIGADGNVYLCCQWRGNKKYSIGNIFKKEFKEVWNSKKHKQIIKKISLDECPPCRNDVYNKLIQDCFIKDKLHRRFL